MRIWRIVKATRSAAAYDGEGSRQTPGRWHDGDRKLVYASESIALATLEKLAQVRAFEGLRGLVAVPAEIPDDAIETADMDDLPGDWKQFPHPASTRAYGNAWYDPADALALIVPSVVVPGSNILLNRAHPRAREIAIGRAVTDAFDRRLTGEP